MRMRALSLLVVLFVGARRAGDPWRLLVWIHIHNVEDNFHLQVFARRPLRWIAKLARSFAQNRALYMALGSKVR